MNGFTITLTIGQLFGAIAIICLVVFTIYIVGVLKEVKKTLQEVREAVRNANEMIEDIQATKMLVVSKIAQAKKLTDGVKLVKERLDKIKQKKKIKQEKKLAKQNKKEKE